MDSSYWIGEARKDLHEIIRTVEVRDKDVPAAVIRYLKTLAEHALACLKEASKPPE